MKMRINHSSNSTSVHPIGVSLNAVDVDDVKARFDELERELQSLYLRVPFGLFKLDVTGTFLTVNQQLLAWLGYTKAELIGLKTFVELLTFDSQTKYQAYLPNHFHIGFIGDIELELVARNGAIRHVCLYSNAILNDDGTLANHRSVLFSTDGHHLAAEKQKADTDRQQVMLNAVMEGFYITNMEGQFLEVNAIYCKMIGYTEAELLKMKIADVEANESVMDIAAHIKKIVSSGQDRFETKQRRKDGSLLDVKVSSHYLQSEGGRLVVFLQDISLMKAIIDQVESLRLEQQELEETKLQLQTALDSSRNLSLAVGIVMGQLQVSKDAAMKLLRKRANDQSIKLNELATVIVNARESLNF